MNFPSIVTDAEGNPCDVGGHDPLEDVAFLEDEIALWIRDILTRGLLADPLDRWGSITEFRNALAAFQRHEGVRKLTEAAQARLVEAQRGDADALQTALFGFQTALDQWPESPDAQLGLDAAQVELVRQSLARNEIDAAERAWAMLASVSREAQPDVAKQLVDAREAWDAIQARMIDLDPRISRDARVRMFTISLLVVSALSLVQWPMAADAVGTFGTGYLAILAVVIAAPSLVLMVWFRKAILLTEVNQRIAILQVLGIAAVTLNRLGGWWVDADPGVVLAVDMMFMAYGTFVAGAFVRQAMHYWGYILTISAVLSFLMPGYAPYFFTISGVICTALLRTFRWNKWENLA